MVFAWVLHKSKAGQIVRRAVLIPDGRKDSRLQKLRNLVLIFDGAGPAVFAVAGTPKALGYGLNPMMAALLGMLTGDWRRNAAGRADSQIPTVLRSELYAVAALAGAVVVVAGYVSNFPPTATAIVGAALCFGIRLIAIRRGWRVPVANLPQRE